MPTDSNTAIALAPETALTPEQQAAILKTLNLNPSDPKTQALMMVCNKYGLDPLLKHAIIIPDKGMYITRDGLMHVAHASGRFDGMELVTLADTPTHFVARASVWRKDMARPFTFDGRFPKSKPMARDYGPEMAQKVALCRALRHAFDVSLCSREETWETEFEEEYPEQAGRAPQPASPRAQVRHEAPPVRPALPVAPPQAHPSHEAAMLEYGEIAARAETIALLPSGRLSPAALKASAIRTLGTGADGLEWTAPGPWIAAKTALVERLAQKEAKGLTPAPMPEMEDPLGPDEPLLLDAPRPSAAASGL